MKKATARRAVMAGTEGEPGFDFYADVIRADALSVVRAVHQKPPGAHRRQSGQRIGDPVALLRHSKSRGARCRLVRGCGDQRADLHLVRLETKISLDQPPLAPARPRLLGLERGRRGFRRLKALDDQVGDRAGALFVAHERKTMGRVVRRETFEHISFSRSRENVAREARRMMIRPACAGHLLPHVGEGVHSPPASVVEEVIHQLRRRCVQPRRLFEIDEARAGDRLG